MSTVSAAVMYEYRQVECESLTTPRPHLPHCSDSSDGEMIDMYSFGIVLWELFCFKKPYQDHDTIELPYLIGKKGIRPPRPLHLPPSLVNLMERCWAEVSPKRLDVYPV